VKLGCRNSVKKIQRRINVFFPLLQWELPRVNLHEDKPITQTQLGWDFFISNLTQKALKSMRKL